MTIDYSKVPVGYMVDSVRNYIEHGIEPGSFLTAVITGDLYGAVGRADATNSAYLKEWCYFFYNYAPSGCWGSVEKMNNWVDSKRTTLA